MGLRKAVLLLAAAVVFLTAVMPQTAGAVDLIVEQNPTDPSHFSDIQTAINNAVNILTTNTGTTICIQRARGTRHLLETDSPCNRTSACAAGKPPGPS